MNTNRGPLPFRYMIPSFLMLIVALPGAYFLVKDGHPVWGSLLGIASIAATVATYWVRNNVWKKGLLPLPRN